MIINKLARPIINVNQYAAMKINVLTDFIVLMAWKVKVHIVISDTNANREAVQTINVILYGLLIYYRHALQINNAENHNVVVRASALILLCVMVIKKLETSVRTILNVKQIYVIILNAMIWVMFTKRRNQNKWSI